MGRVIFSLDESFLVPVQSSLRVACILLVVEKEILTTPRVRTNILLHGIEGNSKLDELLFL